MNLKKNHYSRRALALLLTLVMCVGMIPAAFAAQQNSYHDPAIMDTSLAPLTMIESVIF